MVLTVAGSFGVACIMAMVTKSISSNGSLPFCPLRLMMYWRLAALHKNREMKYESGHLVAGLENLV